MSLAISLFVVVVWLWTLALGGVVGIVGCFFGGVDFVWCVGRWSVLGFRVRSVVVVVVCVVLVCVCGGGSCL